MAKRFRPGGWAVLVCASLFVSSGAFAQTPPAGAKPAPPAPPAGEKGKQAGSDQEKKPPGPKNTGGYSWGEKKKGKRAPRRHYRRVKYDPNAAHATFPGFRMLPDGSSLLWVVLDKRVDVDVRQAKGQVTYVLKGAQVNTRNNTYPLVTTHFATPLSRARLLHRKDGAYLILDLREAVQPAHQVVAGPRGMMVLKVRLPQPTRSYRAPATKPRLKVGGQAPK